MTWLELERGFKVRFNLHSKDFIVFQHDCDEFPGGSIALRFYPKPFAIRCTQCNTKLDISDARMESIKLMLKMLT